MVDEAFEPGSVLRVDLDTDRHCYARALTRPSRYAFLDGVDRLAVDDLAAVVHRPVLFVLAVTDPADRWPVVGILPPEFAPIPVPEQFMQDVVTGRCRIVDAEFNARAATPEECVGLERAAVWHPEDVEERLRDHYDGRENKQMEFMRVQL